MHKTVTLRVDNRLYNLIKSVAEMDHRSIANFIEHATVKFIEQSRFVSDDEMSDIVNDKQSVARVKRSLKDVAQRKYKIVD